MRLGPLVAAGLLLAAALGLVRALVTHDGVGRLEWVVGVVLVAALAAGAARSARRSIRA